MQPDTPCAGNCLHGSCVNGTCICPSGMVGHADLLTGDLTDYGGAVLECTSNVLALRFIWSLVLLFGIIAFIASPLALHQQWHKFKVLRQQGGVHRWYRYRPFLYIVGHLATGLVICYVAVVKVATPKYQRVIGIDPYLSMANLVISSFGLPISAAFFLDMLSTFSQGMRSEITPTPWLQRALVVSRILFILATALVAITGLFAIPYLSVSPYSGRHVHVLCNQLMHLQRGVAAMLLIIASTAFTIEMLRNINHTLRERIVLARWTRSAELRASVASLRRMRFKVVSVQLAAIVANAGSFSIQVWLISNSTRPLYASYSVAYEYLAYVQIILLAILMYIKLEDFTGLQILQAASRFLRSGNGVSPTGQAADPEIEIPCQVDVTAVPSCASTEPQAAPHAVPMRAAPLVIPAAVSEESVAVDGTNVVRAPRNGRSDADKAAGDSSATQASPSSEGGHAPPQALQPQTSEEEEQTGQGRANQGQPRRHRDNWDC